MADISHLTQAITNTRKARSWSQKDLADKLGIKQSQISDIDTGKRDPRLSTFIELARAVGLELVLVPRSLLPAVSYVLRSTSPSKQKDQRSMHESWNEEEDESD
jgi:transcriptional regulator with XRE-family HTH domain